MTKTPTSRIDRLLSSMGYGSRAEMARMAKAGGIVLDDMWIPLGIARAGYRTVFVPEAQAFDRTPANPADEERRKRRTLAGNFQLIHLQPALAIPGAHPLAQAHEIGAHHGRLQQVTGFFGPLPQRGAAAAAA